MIYRYLHKNLRSTFVLFKGQSFLHQIIGATRYQMLTPASQKEFSSLILSTIPLIGFLKDREYYNVYVDSDEPYFRFKLEINQMGKGRVLLLPQGVNFLTEKMTGQCRLVKYLPCQRRNAVNAPYTSVIMLNNTSLKELFNELMLQSFQMDATCEVNSANESSLVFHRLPPKKYDHSSTFADDSGISSEDMDDMNTRVFQDFNSSKKLDEKYFLNIGYDLLDKTPIVFECSCSKQSYIEQLSRIIKGEVEKFFEGETQLEICCDYCHTQYYITPQDFS